MTCRQRDVVALIREITRVITRLSLHVLCKNRLLKEMETKNNNNK